MQFVIITGISGAGRTSALRAFEDIGFFCVDNLPPSLMPLLAEQCQHTLNPPIDRIACAADLRSGVFFDSFFDSMDVLREMEVPPQVLFVEASDAALVQRFKETRRKHPLHYQKKGILESIHSERTLMANTREIADKIIDTTNISPRRLKDEIISSFAPGDAQHGLTILVVSFGFKNGLPLDADLVFDVRFLANPYYVKGLAKLNGTNKEVKAFIQKDPLTQPFMDKLFDLVAFSIPQYIDEGKAYLTIAIGCTGGKHRSVMMANELGKFLDSQGYRAMVQHRDMQR